MAPRTPQQQREHLVRVIRKHEGIVKRAKHGSPRQTAHSLIATVAREHL